MKTKRKFSYETEIIKTTEASKYSENNRRTESDNFDKPEWRGEKYSEPKMGID